MGQRAPSLLILALLLGAGMAGLVAVRWMRTGIHIPLEVGILCLFAVWAIGSGCIVSIEPNLFRQGLERLVQIVFLTACLASMAAMWRTPAIGFFAVTLLAAVFAGYGFLTGDFASAGEMMQKGNRVVGHRAMSLTSNANTLGFFCVWALAGLALLWRKLNHLWQQGLLVGLTLPLLAGAIASGSRKAIVLSPVFFFAWAWFCYRGLILRNGRVFIVCVLVTIAMALAAVHVMEDTFAGQRLHQATAGEGNRDSSTAMRLYMIREGLQMLAKYPLTGVGLNQYISHSSFRSYAHNDYVEVASTTGLVGFLIYYSLFGVVAWRLVRIRRRCLHPEINYTAGVCLAVLTTCAAAGFALVMVSSFAFWCYISGVVGFAYASERDVSRGLVKPRRSVRPVASRRSAVAAAIHRRAGGEAKPALVASSSPRIHSQLSVLRPSLPGRPRFR